MQATDKVTQRVRRNQTKDGYTKTIFGRLADVYRMSNSHVFPFDLSCSLGDTCKQYYFMGQMQANNLAVTINCK